MVCTMFVLLFFYCYGDHRALLSFPTRRSSDLADLLVGEALDLPQHDHLAELRREPVEHPAERLPRVQSQHRRFRMAVRSEEHTSELQSRLHLVCRLLLEKKKKIKKYHQLHGLS